MLQAVNHFSNYLGQNVCCPGQRTEETNRERRLFPDKDRSYHCPLKLFNLDPSTDSVLWLETKHIKNPEDPHWLYRKESGSDVWLRPFDETFLTQAIKVKPENPLNRSLIDHDTIIMRTKAGRWTEPEALSLKELTGGSSTANQESQWPSQAYSSAARTSSWSRPSLSVRDHTYASRSLDREFDPSSLWNRAKYAFNVGLEILNEVVIKPASALVVGPICAGFCALLGPLIGLAYSFDLSIDAQDFLEARNVPQASRLATVIGLLSVPLCMVGGVLVGFASGVATGVESVYGTY